MTRVLDFLGFAVILTSLLLLLVWLQVERNFGWPDVVLATCVAALVASVVAAARPVALRLGWKVPVNVPARFWPIFLVYWALCLVVGLTPAAAVYFFHPADFGRRIVVDALMLSLFLAAGLAFSSSRQAGSKGLPLESSKDSAPRS